MFHLGNTNPDPDHLSLTITCQTSSSDDQPDFTALVQAQQTDSVTEQVKKTKQMR